MANPEMADLLVYLSGPITCNNFDRCLAFHNANMIHRELMYRKLAVMNPILTAHLPFAFDDTFEHSDWLYGDFTIISRCDINYRLPGPSVGADREEEFCLERGIPVVKNLKELDELLDKLRGQNAGEVNEGQKVQQTLFETGDVC